MRALYVVLISTILSLAWGLEGENLPPGVEWGKTDKQGWTWGFPWNEVDKEIGILAPKTIFPKLDERISTSLETTKNNFAQISGYVGTVSKGLKLVPYLGPALSVVDSFVQFLSHETDWKDNFAKAISKQIKQEIAVNDLDNMDTIFRAIKPYILSINDTIQSGSYSEKKNFTMESDANNIYNDLNKITIGFTKENSKFKNFPLLAAPFIIETSLLVSVFEPIQIALIGKESLSCKIRNGLLDYIPFVVLDRLSQLNTNKEKLNQLRNEKFNRTGYNNLEYLDCNSETCVDTCIIDKFSTKNYQRKVPGSNCESNYVRHVRHLVENMFPLEQLDKTCDRHEGEPTGWGWVTFKLEGISMVFRDLTYALSCDHKTGNLKCDPYVKITIGEDEIYTTSVRKDTQYYNVDEIYTSKTKIKKDTTPIKLEVFDADNKIKIDDTSKLGLKIEGTADSFIEKNYYCSSTYRKVLDTNYHNCLEVFSLWQPERNEGLKKNN